MARPTIRALALPLITLVLAGAASCAPEGADATGATAQDLLVETNDIWPSSTVAVCWVNPSATTAARRQWVRDALADAYGPISNLAFTGFGTCTASSTGIRLTISDERPHSDVGRDGDDTANTVLNFAFANWNPGCNDDTANFAGPDGRTWGTHRQYCVSVQAIHEVGHALGFAHEHSRTDVSPPSYCEADEQVSGSNWLGIGDWDAYSIMEQSYCTRSTGRLSPTDIAGIQRFYGRPRNDWVWWIDGNVPDLRGDATMPAGLQITAQPQDIGGTYTPLAGDFDGDGRGDVFWYGRGPVSDNMWWGHTRAAFTVQDGVFDVAGTDYQPITGDFDGDGRTDIFFYRPGEGADNMWWGNANRSFTAQNGAHNVDGTYEPFAGDFDGDGRTDIFWYVPGAGTDRIWWGNANRTFTLQNGLSVDGTYTPLAGDFDGDGDADIFWYRPGTGTDVMWWSNGAARTFASSTAIQQDLVADAFVGDFNGNGRADIFFNQPNATADYVWSGRANKTFGWIPTSMYRTYQAVVGNFDGQGPDDIFWYTPGSAL